MTPHRILLAIAVFAACASAAALQSRGDAAEPSPEPASALWGEIATVLQSPRCMNCHTDAAHAFPRQGDDRHRHMFNVQRGPVGSGAAGLHCSTCHHDSNNAASGVPGAEGWHLAPLSMAWEGLSANEICQQLTDPARNGGRSAAQIADHFAHEPLVLWSWSPGADHAGVVRSVPPLSHPQFMTIVSRWATNGAVCPK
jgi:hypothetical protein